MKAIKDDGGQMSIDFLIGIMIFLIAFIFLFAAIPSMFTPFQSNSDELTMIADRVAATLVENELCITAGTNESLPSIIDIAKVDLLNDRLSNPAIEEATRKKLGLDNGNTVYHLQVLLQLDNGTTISIPGNDKPGNQNVGQSRRFVYVRYMNGYGTAYYPGLKALLVVRVW